MIEDNWTLAGVLYTRYLGFVDGQELINASLQKSGDERLDSVRYIIGDWTEVERTEISASQVQELICCLTGVARICPKAINASIVRRNDTSTSLVAWYRHLGDILPWQIDIFHDVEEAFQAYSLDYAAMDKTN